MGQDWYLINLDGRLIYDRGKLGEVFYEPQEWLEQQCMRPTITKSKGRGRSLTAGSKSLGALSLPPEVIKMIFNEFERLQDAVSLSLAHSLLEEIGKQRVDALRDDMFSSFRNSRILCIGDRSEHGSLPENLLTGLEQRELNASWRKGEGGWNGQAEPMTLAELAVNRYTDKHPPFRSRHARNCWPYDSNLEYKLPKSEFERFEDLFLPGYRGDVPWVLCNLSKHEFVLARTVAKFVGDPNEQGPFFDGTVGFGTVLMARICWSTSDQTHMGYTGDIHRGVWAGDRFDIVTVDQFEEELKGTYSWKDVGEQVMKEIEEIFESEFGETWRHRLHPHLHPQPLVQGKPRM